MWRSNFYFLRVRGVSKRSNQFKKAIYLKVMSIEACGKFLNTILVFTCKPYNVLKCSVFPLPDRHMSTQQSNSQKHVCSEKYGNWHRCGRISFFFNVDLSQTFQISSLLPLNKGVWKVSCLLYKLCAHLL